jgi:hypothetical protein
MSFGVIDIDRACVCLHAAFHMHTITTFPHLYTADAFFVFLFCNFHPITLGAVVSVFTTQNIKVKSSEIAG